MKLVFVPPENVQDLSGHWIDWAHQCAKRDRLPSYVYVNPVLDGMSHLFVVWDQESQTTAAAFAVEVVENIAGIQWFGGIGPDDWMHLLDELHGYMQQMGCTTSRIMMRPGFARKLKAYGYRTRSIVLERTL